MKRTTLLLMLAALLLLAHVMVGTRPTHAAQSTNYKLAWFTPLAGGGGGRMASAHYAADVTVGQSVVGTTATAAQRACLGYWCGVDIATHTVFLPLAVRS